MKVLRVNFFLFLSLVMVSCFNKKHITVPSKEIDFRNMADITTQGSKLDIEVLGIKDICICDSWLLFNTRDASGYLKIYSLDNLEELASVCPRGRAANEFNSPSFLSKQYYHRDGDILLPMIDNKAFIKEVNLTQSLKSHRTVIGERGDNMNSYLGTSLIVNKNLSERFEYYYSVRDEMAVEEDNYLPPYYYLTNGEDKKQIKVFPRVMDSDEGYYASVCYSSGLINHPSKNIVVQFFTFMDYLLYFDLDNKNTFAVHQSGSLSFDSFMDSRANGGKTIFHFCAADCTPDFLLFLYGANDATIRADDYENAPFDILLFDWEGNYLTGARLNHVVHDIAYDSKNKIMYGIDRSDESVYRFDLSELVIK